MPNQATARAPEQDIINRLARFFPGATPVRIPIKLSRTLGEHNNGNSNNGHGNGNDNDSGNNGNHQSDAAARQSEQIFFQNTVIEFGTPREVLFVVNHPLEFADRVLVESTDGFLRAEAYVVAVQYHTERTAVAVRFLNHVPNWIVKS